jgi:hypothetical protein
MGSRRLIAARLGLALLLLLQAVDYATAQEYDLGM